MRLSPRFYNVGSLFTESCQLLYYSTFLAIIINNLIRYILPGLKDYRERYNNGSFVIDMRLGYKLNDNYRLGFMVNNLLNSEYTSRPGDIQPPRNFSLQVQMKF